METRTRTLVKAVSWQLLGLVTMTLIAWVFTGSVEGSIRMALSSCLSGLVFYMLHERAWQQVRWGRREINETVQ